MTISSRTPEGTPNRCPICAAVVCVEPSQPIGDAPCPACGTLLWFVATDTGQQFFSPEGIGLLERVAERLGISLEEVRGRRLHELGLDSLDLVELVMDLEEQMG